MSNVAVIEPRAKSVLLDMADRYGMEAQAFEATLRATVVPGNCSREQFAAFLLVAKEYKLNPLLKEIYAFPSKGGIQPIVGVDGWANLINSHPAFDGMDFEDRVNDAGELVSITCKMFRKDRSHPTTATEYLAECKRPTEPWQKWPRRMLRHKAMIQAARYAFSFAGIIDPDEAERYAADIAHDVTPPRPALSDRLAAAQKVEQVDGFSQAHVINEIDGNTNSSQANAPAQRTETDAPASGGQSGAPPDAGNLSTESSSALAPNTQADDEGGGDDSPTSPPPNQFLPQGWQQGLVAALRRATRKDSLVKLAKQYFEQLGQMPTDPSDKDTAKQIRKAFEEYFDDAAELNKALREII